MEPVFAFYFYHQVSFDGRFHANKFGELHPLARRARRLEAQQYISGASQREPREFMESLEGLVHKSFLKYLLVVVFARCSSCVVVHSKKTFGTQTWRSPVSYISIQID